MSENTPVSSDTGSQQTLAILAFVVIAALLLLYFSGSNQIERSAIGTDGLAIWLEENGVETELTAPQELKGEKTPILRILPLYDFDLTVEDRRSDTDAQVSDGATLRDLPFSAFMTKIESADTLVVMPKWYGRIIKTAEADPEFLIPANHLTVFGPWRDASLRSAGEDFVVSPIVDARTDETLDGEAALYAPRVLSGFADEFCEPMLTLGELGTLMAVCDDIFGEGTRFYLLSDPDLINNHGLANGDNATISSALIESLADGRPVYIDNTTFANITDNSGLDPRERSIADLRRFFEYPLSLLWIGVVIAAGLALWRGSRRFGAPLGMAGSADMASKARTIKASSRLLRLSGSQNDLVSAYVEARMDALAVAVLGPSRSPMGAEETSDHIMARVRRRMPETGDRLAQTYKAVTAINIDSQKRLSALPPFEKAVQETLDAFGHA